MNNANRIARIQIHEELIRQFLRFPEGTEISDIYRTPAGKIDRVYTLVVRHGDLPEVEDGDEIPLITPVYEKINFHWNRDGLWEVQGTKKWTERQQES